MSDSGEAESPEQESQPKSQEGETTKNSNKRTLDDDSKNETSGLENLKKVAKSTARKIEFEKTEDDDALPLACSICRKPFLDPVVTNCNHYFCNHCALKHHEKNNNCFVCNQPTLGVFNAALEIKELIAKVREKARAMVKEVSTMVAKAAAIRKDADAMVEESAEIMEEVDAMLEIVKADGAQAAADPTSWDAVVTLVETMEVAVAKAREMAEKAGEMVKEANATTETAKAEMAKALVVMKSVKWNV